MYRQKFRDVVNMSNSELGMIVLAAENRADELEEELDLINNICTVAENKINLLISSCNK